MQPKNNATLQLLVDNNYVNPTAVQQQNILTKEAQIQALYVTVHTCRQLIFNNTQITRVTNHPQLISRVSQEDAKLLADNVNLLTQDLIAFNQRLDLKISEIEAFNNRPWNNESYMDTLMLGASFAEWMEEFNNCVLPISSYIQSIAARYN
jgi:hypothetical protein